MAAPLNPSDKVIIATQTYGSYPTKQSKIKNRPGMMCAKNEKEEVTRDQAAQVLHYLQNMQNVFLVAVGLNKFLCLMLSPTLPKMKPKMSRNRYGRLDKNPASVSLKPRASLMNFGAAVIRKKSPHVLPK